MAKTPEQRLRKLAKRNRKEAQRALNRGDRSLHITLSSAANWAQSTVDGIRGDGVRV